MSKRKVYVFGNEVRWQKDGHPRGPKGGWAYTDNGEPNTLAAKMARKCPRCHQHPTPEGHDPCIANLPGVDYACCGHGVEPGYVKFSNGQILRGIFDHLRDPPLADATFSEE